MLIVAMLKSIMLSVTMLIVECRHAECRFAECCYVECRYDEWHCTERYYCYTECSDVICQGFKLPSFVVTALLYN
jgi:hypothetical protein